MASEYYKWLARDVKPEEKKVLTREEKWHNWWSYHKWHVVIGIFCVIFIANIAYDIASNARNEPDYKIAYVGSTALPEDTVEALELAFAALGEDLSGNGEVRVELKSYVLSEQSEDASMLLLMNIETVESMIFLLEDPEGFAADYPILTGTPLYHRWTDCPVLEELDLPLETLSIACRGLWNNEGTQTTEGALRLFDRLTGKAN